VQLGQSPIINCQGHKDFAQGNSHSVEHRWGNRLQVDLPVLLRRRDHGTGEGLLIEASVSGALIRTDLKLSDLTPVEIRIDGESVAVNVIRHTTEGAIALEWSELAPRRVMRMLKSLIESPSMSNRNGNGRSLPHPLASRRSLSKV
jgi:hypothetical protein